AVGVIRASVPTGGGPAAHVHAGSDETFVMLDGELEFLDGDKTFIAGPGDLVYIPGGIRHRFQNVGPVIATMVLLYTPAGPEGLFVEGGDEPQPGVQGAAVGPGAHRRTSAPEVSTRRPFPRHPDRPTVMQTRVAVHGRFRVPVRTCARRVRGTAP